MASSQVPIGQIATVIMGQSPKGETYNKDGVGMPLLNGPTEFGPSHPACTVFTVDSKRECKKADLIFCVRGSTTGRMNWADSVYSLGRGVCAIRGKSEFDTKFIRYCLENRLSSLLKLAGGGTFPNLTKDDINNFPIPFPQNRHKIASILSAYDDLIENNTRRIKILEEMAQMIYREWFVKFRFPGHEKVKMVDSAMGMIPEGWEVKPVTEAVEINPRTTVPKEGEKPFVPMGSLSNNSMLISDIESRTGNSGSKFKNGDTLFARITPCLENGKTAFVQFLPTANAAACGSTEFIVLRSKTLCPEYVYLMARSDEFRNNAIKSMSGATGRQRVSDKCFAQYFVAQPDSMTLVRFTDHVSSMFKAIHNLASRNDNLRQTRDLLLPRLISGVEGLEILTDA